MIDGSVIGILLGESSLEMLGGGNPFYEVQAKVALEQGLFESLQIRFEARYGHGIESTFIQTRYRSGPGGQGDFRLRLYFEPIRKQDESDAKPSPGPADGKTPDLADGSDPHQGTAQGIGEATGAAIIYREDLPGQGVAAKQRREACTHIPIETYGHLCRALRELNVYHDPPWIKRKIEFTAGQRTPDQSDLLKLSLQEIAGQKAPLGYVLEASLKLRQPDEGAKHYNSIVAVLSEFGLEPTDGVIFNGIVRRFIAENT